ncbi:hypothetical protein [Flavonifractor plautii]|uniref:hypothetical protein n=1 Tax=Flavonifractor plautii TaxID=292800 RepID=UPI00232F1255|nr:hypothetical protein [Flavonifractor plautii]MDB7955575.1 hypothetical protein [Flavonifractor plautii]
MNRKEQQLLRQRQTTRQLMGVTRLTEHGAVCGRDELLFYLLRPDNLSILSPEGIRGRVKALTGLLQGMASLELLALDSREAFLKNKQYYQWRLEEEPSPALRELLRQDIEHLNARQSSTAASREFALVCRLDSKAAEDREELPRRLEKQIRDHGFHVHLAGEQDMRRILAVYYQQDVVTEDFDSIDGERWATEHG